MWKLANLEISKLGECGNIMSKVEKNVMRMEEKGVFC